MLKLIEQPYFGSFNGTFSTFIFRQAVIPYSIGSVVVHALISVI